MPHLRELHTIVDSSTTKIIWRPVKKEGSIQIQDRYESRRRAREWKRKTAERI